MLAPLTAREGAGQACARVVLPLASLAPSTYTVRVEVNAGNNSGAQVVAFTVSQ